MAFSSCAHIAEETTPPATEVSGGSAITYPGVKKLPDC
jgi:hypothetical protein